ncbi:unnamed protein product [Prunus brigantina]
MDPITLDHSLLIGVEEDLCFGLMSRDAAPTSTTTYNFSSFIAFITSSFFAFFLENKITFPNQNKIQVKLTIIVIKIIVIIFIIVAIIIELTIEIIIKIVMVVVTIKERFDLLDSFYHPRVICSCSSRGSINGTPVLHFSSLSFSYT